MEAADLLKENKLKATRARRTALESILALNGRHFNADDILTVLHHNKKSISRASIFRAIQVFHEAGLLRMIEVSKYGCKYECVVHDHHDHLCCMKCGTIIEFTQRTIEKLQAKVCSEFGFQPVSHILKITGLCKKCNKTVFNQHNPARKGI